VTGATARLAMAVAATAIVVGPLAAPAVAVAPQKSSVFAGYDVSKSKAVRAAAVDFTVPRITCKKSESGVGPAVILVSAPNKKGSFTFSGAGVGVVCEHKVPTYQAIVIINGKPDNSFDLAVGDQVRVTVKVTKAKTTVSVHDLVSKASKTLAGPGRVMSAAEIGVQGIAFGKTAVGIDPFTRAKFTDAKVDGHSLTKEKAFPVERTHGKTVQIAVGKLSKGTDFAVTFKHS
jgi:hypothetical protein